MTLHYYCPCCGYRASYTPLVSPRQPCPICFYFDIPLASAHDRWQLWVAQTSYVNIRASDLAWVSEVRDPAPGEPRDPSWKIDNTIELRRSLLKGEVELSIRDAFASVPHPGSETLGAAYRYEIHDLPGVETQLAKPWPWEWNDQDRHWSEVPDEALEKSFQIASIFSFGNYASYRYYIPAYLLLDIRTLSSLGLIVLSSSRIVDRGDVSAPPEFLLDAEQRGAACAYLRYISEFAVLATERCDAATTLRRYS